MGIEFLVDKNVLIPRQDTEILVSAVLQHLGENGASILDIGCGSGCVGLSICYHNKRVYTTGVDISPQAIQISEENAKKLGLAERAVFKKADILKDHLAGHYDVLVSNPPYIKEADIKNLQIEVRDFEPHLALSGGEDGLVFYRRITKEAKKLLRTGGLLAYEVGENQAKDVENIMLENGFANIETVKDLCGIDRVVTGIL